jgi:hypothetical protein
MSYQLLLLQGKHESIMGDYDDLDVLYKFLAHLRDVRKEDMTDIYMRHKDGKIHVASSYFMSLYEADTFKKKGVIIT